jgi:hypothetical protein
MLAFGLRAWRLDYHSYRGDETFVVWFVAQDWGALVAAIARNEPHPPLYYLIAKLWRDALGDGEFVFRFVPLLFGVLAAPIAGKLGARIAGGRIGVAVGAGAALLLAVNPFHVWNAQDARMYTQSVALTLWSLLAFCRLAERPGDRGRLLQYGLISAGAVWTHYTFLPILAVQNLIWIGLFRRRKGGLGPWFAVQAGLAALALSWIAVNSALLAGYVGNGDQPALIDAIRRTGAAYLTGRSGSPEWASLAGAIGLLVAVGGAIWLVRRSGWLGWLVALSVVAGFAAQWIASLRGPVFTETYLLTASGPFFVLLAAGIVAAGRLFLPLGIAGLAAALLVAALSLTNYWTNPAYAKGADWRSEARAIAAEARAGDVIVLNYPDPTFEYYYRGAAPVRLVPATVPFERSAVERELAGIVDGASRIWLVPVRAANWDRDGLVEGWLNDHADPIATAAWHQVRLVLYETPRGALATATPLTATLGEIRARGASVTPADCAAPCPVVARIVWSADRTPSADYKVFVHALDERGALATQSDGVPADWRRPTTGWAPGELIVDAHDLTLPRPGRYRLIAGLYRENGGRLTAADGAESVAIGEVTVR